MLSDSRTYTQKNEILCMKYTNFVPCDMAYINTPSNAKWHVIFPFSTDC